MYVLLAETGKQSYSEKFSPCTVVSIPAESRITRADEQSLCICTCGIVLAAIVGILSTLINA